MNILPIAESGTLTLSSAQGTGGELKVTGYNGNIVRWESSTDGFNNVQIIANTTSQLAFVVSTVAVDYRAVVELGGCGEVLTNVKRIEPFQVFSSFSPNGDGVNDSWIIAGIELFSENRVRIFNRIGDLVYEQDNYNNEGFVWKGESNAGHAIGKNELPDGTYFYFIEIGEKLFKGYVVIKR
jgi:gliding motility-associated-like protein